MDLSPLANALLIQHRAEYRPDIGGKEMFRRLPGYTDDQLSQAYEELAAAGVMEAGSVAVVGDTPRKQYRLSGEGQAVIATPAAAG